jgi:hypothetical protein
MKLASIGSHINKLVPIAPGHWNCLRAAKWKNVLSTHTWIARGKDLRTKVRMCLFSMKRRKINGDFWIGSNLIYIWRKRLIKLGYFIDWRDSFRSSNINSDLFLTWQTEQTMCLVVIKQYDGKSKIRANEGFFQPHSVEYTIASSTQKIGSGESPRSASTFGYLLAARPLLMLIHV